jgi:hypothetical protein
MTHLIFRNGRAYFRYRLPPELRALPRPAHWPKELQELVSEVKPEQLKNELSKALDTRDERLAKRRAAVEVIKAEDLIRRATEFLQNGPRASLSSADIALMAAQYGSRMVRNDLEQRKDGIGLRLPTVGLELSAKLLGKTLPKATIDKSEPGLTDDDLDLLKFAVERMAPEI